MKKRIYEMVADPDYVGLTFVDVRMWTFPRENRMATLLARGGIFDVELNDENANPESELIPDFVHFAAGYCCASREVWTSLSTSLRWQGPTIGLRYSAQSKEYVLFEPYPKIDCLDFEQSEVRYFDTAPFRVMWVDRIVLCRTASIGVDIFRLKHFETTIFCTDACRQFVNDSAFTGLLFKPVEVSS